MIIAHNTFTLLERLFPFDWHIHSMNAIAKTFNFLKITSLYWMTGVYCIVRMLKYTIHHKYHLISIAGVVFYDECLLIWWQLHYLFMFTSKIDGNTLRTLKTQNTISFP